MNRRVSTVKTVKVATRVVPTPVLKKAVQVKATTTAHNSKIRKLGFSLSSLQAGVQMVIALSAVGFIFLLGTVDQNIFSTRESRAEEATQNLIRNTMTVGLSYKRPLNLSVLIARKANDAMYASIENAGNEEIVVSVPSDWRREEVKGTSLDRVVAGVPTFGFTAWTFPAGATVTFTASRVPDAIFFDTASTATAAINLVTALVQGDDSSINKRVVLLQKQVLAPLWGQE